MATELTSKQLEALQDIQEAIQRGAEHIGPYWSGQDSTGEVGEKDALLGEWVVIAAWTLPESGETFTTMFAPDHQVRHHTKGLLHQGLYWNIED